MKSEKTLKRCDYNEEMVEDGEGEKHIFVQ
jgi:hypothetical protein